MSWWRPARWQHASKVLVHVFVVLLGLELFYLVVANSLLKSSLIKRAVASADGLQLEYGSAFSWLPGRVRVSDLSLRMEDYNVQFLLKIEGAELDMGLDELLHKRFHVFHLRAFGVSFFMRHKLHQAAGHGERLAAFPKIAGFADPPLYRGARPPPIPDEDYDLWQVQVEDVIARAKELWFLEYRFQGNAEARGAFLIRPARLVKVQPADLQIASGSLSLGEHVVARSVKGNISVALPNMDVQKTEGVQVFHELSVQAQLELTQSDLDFLNAYRESGDPSVQGAATWSVRTRVQRGVAQPGTLLACDASELQLTFPGKAEPSLLLSGATLASAAVTESAPAQITLSTSAARLVLSRLEHGGVSSKLPSPTLEKASLTAAVRPVDLSQPLRVVPQRASVVGVHVPNLFWLEPWLSSDGSLRVDGEGNASLEASCDESRICRLERARVDAVGARLALGARASDPWSGSLSVENVLVPWFDPKLAGRARLEVSSGRALLPLVTSLPIKDAVSSALGLSQVRASFALSGTKTDYRLELLEARSGSLSARGRYRRQLEHDQGALLFSTDLLNVGVTLRDGQTSVSLLVADDWLKKRPEGR